MEKEEPYFDKKGKEIKEFAIIKVFHFKGVNDQGRGRNNYYMYKQVRLKEHNGKKYWIALHLEDDSGAYYHLRTHKNETGNKLLDTEVVQQQD